MKLEEYRIGLVGFLVLMTLTVITGISVYAVMQHQAESILSRSLEVSLKSGMSLFGNQITQRINEAQMIASRPFVADNLLKRDKTNNDLQRAADFFVLQGLKGVAFYNAAGIEVASAGRFLQDPKLRMPVDTEHSAFLIWDGQFMLNTRTDITDQQHRRIGAVVVESDLKLPAHAMADVISVGQTGEFALCSPLQKDPQDMDCFLHRISGWKFQRLHRAMKDQALPMSYALDGKTGIIHAKDYRGVKVVAAYAPLNRFNLGAVLKIDQSELYSPVTEQLKYISLLVAALVIIGGLLLYWMMTPLVRQLIASRLALKNENDKSLALLHNASDGIHILDMSGNIIEVSDSFCEMLGYSRSEMIGMNVTQWDAEIRLSSAELNDLFNRNFARHERMQFERHHKRKDGSIFDAEISAYPLLLGGKPVLFNSSRDITDRKKKDDELLNSKKRLDELFENMSSGVAVYQADGSDFIFTDFNRSAERMNNARREDLIGRKLTEAFPGSQKMGLLDAFRRVWNSGKAEHFPVSFYEDERISGWWDNYIYKIDSGEIVAIFDDVTERKHAEEALQESQEKLRAVVDTALDAIVQMDSNGIITGWNIQAEKTFGWSSEEAIGKLLHETIIPPQYREAHIQGLKRFQVSGEGQALNTWIEIQGLHRSGSEFPVELAVVPIKVKKKYEFHAFIRNLTERRQAEALIRMQSDALNSSTNGVAIAEASDPELPLLYVNPAFERITGYPASELLGKNCRFLQGEDRDQPGLAEIRACLKEGRSGKATLRNYKKDGTLFWNRLSISPIFDKTGKLVQFLGIANDITERKLADDHLRLISSVFDHADEGILITDKDGVILEANPACSRITGYSREEMLGKDPRILHSGRQDRQFYETMWHEVTANGYWSGEVWNKRKNGEIYPERLTLSAVKNEEGQIIRYIALFSDISDIKSHQQQLEHLAHHDTLTGLPNRTLLNDRFEMALAQVRRSGGKLAVCFMDLDGFKPVNDNFGHEAGDILLVEVAQRMLAISRSTDTVARLGGDEFVLIFTDISGKSECQLMLSRVMNTITQPFNIDGHEIRISASIGVAFYPDDDGDGDSLLRHADQAMYVAKQAGRGRFHFFDATIG